ncbi:bifunctional cytochrome P450/NADPH--P450 reductase [Pectobacterium colocasium]|uniref:bifunctional cytochrome P450/NADPH--P450 reductase n=1 Tax=Pectobacterium colocasium TaxID=2878098 RepID=UPI001CD21BD7|nr:cytochrome P450 [Pectobacterium colocasium]
MSERIVVPQPPVKPFIGNLTDIDPNDSQGSLTKLVNKHGPFFKLKILKDTFYVASSQELVDELSDESRFEKCLHGELIESRNIGGDGLFTAYTHEPNWGKAHRILMPALGPIGVRGMFDKMLDIAEQMLLRWERFGPDMAIDVADQMTRLTLDTIALCGFDYRFNSFYRDGQHPFVDAMVASLLETAARSRRPAFLNTLLISRDHQYRTDIDLMHSVARQVVSERKADPKGNEKDDLLHRMLNGVDPVTGEKLSDENIAYQMVTFLIAGHETTSGMLSFTVYLLLTNPDVLRKARSIVDEVMGDETPRIEHLTQLRYLEQVLMESLRLWPTAGAFALKPIKDTLLAGKYPLTPQDIIVVFEPMLHRDKSAWGEDAEVFRPERFSLENAGTILPNSWKPFGTGARACIGRTFAMQEAQLVLAMLLQRFDFELADANYELKLVETITVKPANLKIRARIRRPSTTLTRSVSVNVPRAPTTSSPIPESSTLVGSDATPLLVLHAGNTGSSEMFAVRIAEDAKIYGFAPTLASLDEYAENLPQTGALVVVTASYEGQPPNNARRFVPWVENLGTGALAGLQFCVFGCGNLQWARTYQAIPKRVDAALEKAGAQRIKARGEADSGGDFFGSFDDWYGNLWPTLTTAFGKQALSADEANTLELEFVKVGRESVLQQGDMVRGMMTENRELVDMTSPYARSKRHIEIRLPEGMTYRAGDYLAVLPQNPDEQVNRVLRRFGLASDMMLVINRSPGGTGLPVGQAISCAELLGNYVELSQPATRAHVAVMAAATRCPPEKAELERLATEHYDSEVLAQRFSVLDLLYRFQSCPIDFATYLKMLPPMKTRQYSISSSPLWKPDHVTLTIAVVDAPALSGLGRHRGVASSYLATLSPNDSISVAVRPSGFHLPDDPATPLILIAAGSGVAPFRGFLQERAQQKAAGIQVGPTLLFLGVNHPDVDYLYHDELADWEKNNIVTVLTAFSRKPDGDIKYVQHRVWAERERLKALFCQGASIFVCGDGLHMAPEVRAALLGIYCEETGSTEADAILWADKLEQEQGRYAADIFI